MITLPENTSSSLFPPNCRFRLCLFALFILFIVLSVFYGFSFILFIVLSVFYGFNFIIFIVLSVFYGFSPIYYPQTFRLIPNTE